MAITLFAVGFFQVALDTLMEITLSYNVPQLFSIVAANISFAGIVTQDTFSLQM